MRPLLVCALTLLVGASDVVAERSKSPEQKKQEHIRKAARKAASLERSDPDVAFVRDRAQDLLLRAEQAAAGSWQLDRLMDALEDLLDAGEELAKASRRGGESDKQPDAADTARLLERTYFRVTQADYYARIGADASGPEYVRMARRLYQGARRAYDGRDYRRARRLAGAAEELVDTLENLAQAAVRVPDPPKLED